MIEVRELTKSYGDRMAIENLNFKINKGEVVGFLGPNGAGKSTTMKIITGYMAPSSGQVTVAGYDVFENPIEVKRRIGYLPEIPPVYGDMKVQDYLRFVAALKGVERGHITRHVESALEKTNLGEVRSRLIQNLSKGFKQRVGLAQALVSDPEILILDEPTVGLDPKQVAEIRQLILQLKGHHTLVLSTHILPEVQATCERVIIINRGRIVAEDTLQSLSRRMSGGSRLHVSLRRAEEGHVGGLSGLEGVASVQKRSRGVEIDFDGREDTIEAISSYLVEKKAGLVELRVQEADLEDIFIRLTAADRSSGVSNSSLNS